MENKFTHWLRQQKSYKTIIIDFTDLRKFSHLKYTTLVLLYRQPHPLTIIYILTFQLLSGNIIELQVPIG